MLSCVFTKLCSVVNWIHQQLLMPPLSANLLNFITYGSITLSLTGVAMVWVWPRGVSRTWLHPTLVLLYIEANQYGLYLFGKAGLNALDSWNAVRMYINSIVVGGMNFCHHDVWVTGSCRYSIHGRYESYVMEWSTFYELLVSISKLALLGCLRLYSIVRNSFSRKLTLLK